MRVVVITGTAPHHRQLCTTLYRTGMVVGIIHPEEIQLSLTRRFQREIRLARKYGLPHALLRVFGRMHSLLPAKDCTVAAQPAELTAYDRIPRSIIHIGCNVRSAVTVNLLRSLRPDVTVCLGGPVYPKALIEASPLILNFHSGISPLYNGTASIRFAFANGHPHLCGGTLMAMGTSVDGGGILGHYLPEIRAGDSSTDLFARTVQGACVMYERILNHLAKGHSILGSIAQPPPLFYYRGFEYGWTQEIMLRRHLREDLCARHIRSEILAEYWREPTRETMHEAYRATLDRLLWRSAEIGNH